MNDSLSKASRTQDLVRRIDRRDFLKLAGFTFTGAFLAGCQQANVEKAIPYLIKPEELTPGVASWYATTCGGCSAGCGIMAKVRDGRPIKLEGLPDHPVSSGGLCAVGQASLLSLYDSQRLMKPLIKGSERAWDEVNGEVVDQLDRIREKGGAVRILTGTVTSRTTLRLIDRFLGSFRDARHVQYDPVSVSSIPDAHSMTHGVRSLPRYHFERASVIASFDADFLGTWISPVEFTRGFVAGRNPGSTGSDFSYHIQFESRLSMTGAKADRRVNLDPSEVRGAVRQLAALITAKAGGSGIRSDSSPIPAIDDLATRLWAARGSGLVVCGVNDRDTQVLVNSINHALGNYGTTLDLASASNQKKGDDTELYRLIKEVRDGKIDALIIQGANPLYDLPFDDGIRRALANIPLTVRLADRVDETAAIAHVVCPEPHALESWMDGEPVAGVLTMAQPAIKPFGDGRSLMELLSVWMGEEYGARDLIQREWQSSVFPFMKKGLTEQTLWDQSVQRGFVHLDGATKVADFRESAVIDNTYRPEERSDNPDAIALALHASSSMLDGRHAHNPWLQELPDPISKIVWDNYASVSPALALRLGISEGDVVRIDAGGKAIELPAHLQLGQHDRVVAVGLGYGRKGTDRFASIGPEWIEAEPTVRKGSVVGVNAAPLIEMRDSGMVYDRADIRITNTGRKHELAATQEYHSLTMPANLRSEHEGERPVVQETTPGEYSRESGGHAHSEEHASLWGEGHSAAGHRWGMVIDLTACTGCSACVVSCQAENNIPLVGKDEVGRNREMTWLRIDRYFDETKDGELRVAHQPMMCHHCANAPCETVCPVLATVHSEEGLNQQVYNRCVGTRYCSNNCPYKIRRFNWFEYGHGDDMQKLVLNPDVTVRERGVMEKCSFCVQRIQEAKINAKAQNKAITDGDISAACQQSCPAQAIHFGDMNDPKSRVSERMRDPRFYRVLDELGVKPSVGYLKLVRTTDSRRKHG